MNTRINAIEHIEQALRTLEAYEYDTKSVWAEHNAWLQTLDAREPDAEDFAWATQNAAPSSILEHAGDGKFEQLTAGNCFVGRQFTLSSGQRDLLRERHGLTPTREVEITNVTTFKDTNIIWSFSLKSTEHIDPRRRKHVLVETTIAPAAHFFKNAAHLDSNSAEQADAKRMIARVERLIKRADEQKVKHKLHKPGTVGLQLHGIVRTERITDPKIVRETLRGILISRGEDALAELVKEPSAWPVDSVEPTTAKQRALVYME